MPTSSELLPAPTRVDAARERVVRLLTDRYADDTLTVEEFEARLDQMHALQSADALDAMARALAGPTGRQAPAAPRAAGAPARMQGVLPERILAVMGNTRRTGAWVVPPRLRVVAVMSNVALDLREAVLPPSCEIEVLAVMGNLKLWLPPGAQGVVEVDAVMANVDERRARPSAGPQVRVTGTVVMGEVKVRRENW